VGNGGGSASARNSGKRVTRMDRMAKFSSAVSGGVSDWGRIESGLVYVAKVRGGSTDLG
jgi:hypothetical protein